MSFYYLLTLLPELPRKIVPEQMLENSVADILSLIEEESSKELRKALYIVRTFEDLKNILAHLNNLEVLFTPFTSLGKEFFTNFDVEYLESDDFVYAKFFRGLDLKQDIFSLEEIVYTRFYDDIDSRIFKDFYRFELAIRYLYEAEDLEKKEQAQDDFDAEFDKSYILAKELLDNLETMHPYDRELFVANLKLSYLRKLSRNIYFEIENLEVYLLSLAIYSRFEAMNLDLAKQKLKNFVNFNLEF